jgi:hypothetical protein
VILPLAACGVVAAMAGVSVADRSLHPFVQLLLGASVSGGVFLLLAGGTIMKAGIYRDIRSRIVTVSRGLAAELKSRSMPLLARLRK